MPRRDKVSEGVRPEETHRPAADHPPHPQRVRARGPLSTGDGAARLLHTLAGRRFRLQAAGTLAILLIAFLTLILLRPRTVPIIVDGEVTTVNSRASDENVLVEQAGIDLEPGDEVEAAGDGALAVKRATEAVLEVDGRAYALRSQDESIETLLAQAQVQLAPQDSVLRNDRLVSPNEPVAPAPSLASVLRPGSVPVVGGTASSEPVALEVRRAVPFTVFEDGQQLELQSSRETVATALRDVGVRLGPGDDVLPSLDTELSAGVTVQVQHATQIVVTMPAGKTILYTLASTIDEALAGGAVDLPAQYRLDPPAVTPISAGLTIHVIGVSNEQQIEEERIESRTLYQPDSSLPYGQRRVVQGHDGIHHRQFRAVYEDGQLISRELVTEWSDPQPADTVIYYSTASAPPVAPSVPLEVPDGLHVVRVVRVYATWYNAASSGRSPSDPAYGITATGVRVDRGVVAVDPSVIPLGTHMYVPGYGNGTAADTGGAIRGNVIDLGYPDGVIPNWTSRWVDIYILGP
ncbi:MAG: ubiquitin-like domain-containing protein [Dehalococcoidia bacterium]